jgi:hypothetical protein
LEWKIGCMLPVGILSMSFNVSWHNMVAMTGKRCNST